MAKTFTVTDDHYVLFRRANITWDNCEYGAPEINPKRPYGNGDVARDIHEILGWPMECNEYEEYELDDDRAWEIHKQMETALQIMVQHPGEDIRGQWVREGWSKWTRA